ncbi:hypothetical protein BC937DRAFT_86855 [Endogone sp. FLAS-F59071]|nr:hypothetical protein BC937DRAFT_86855 [Endogone sp. FLAS-F59071]|eukprot:RUS19815.1 hypothetical protein BC937DRAFT_86855 [Endogone sp. FLAS-F59071]
MLCPRIPAPRICATASTRIDVLTRLWLFRLGIICFPRGEIRIIPSIQKTCRLSARRRETIYRIATSTKRNINVSDGQDPNLVQTAYNIYSMGFSTMQLLV